MTSTSSYASHMASWLTSQIEPLTFQTHVMTLLQPSVTPFDWDYVALHPRLREVTINLNPPIPRRPGCETAAGLDWLAWPCDAASGTLQFPYLCVFHSVLCPATVLQLTCVRILITADLECFVISQVTSSDVSKSTWFVNFAQIGTTITRVSPVCTCQSFVLRLASTFSKHLGDWHSRW